MNGGLDVIGDLDNIEGTTSKHLVSVHEPTRCGTRTLQRRRGEFGFLGGCCFQLAHQGEKKGITTVVCQDRFPAKNKRNRDRLKNRRV